MNFGHVNILSNSLSTSPLRRRGRRAPDIRKPSSPAPLKLEAVRDSKPSTEYASNEQRDSRAA